MTVTEYAAEQTLRIAASFVHFLNTADPVQLYWKKPLQEGASTRSIMEQAAECVEVNNYFAAFLRGEENPAREELAFPDLETLLPAFTASAEAIASAIRSLSEADLEKEFHHPRALIKGSNLILMAYRNMAYHIGQLNFIETLHGDLEFHAPSNWR